jgi:UTP--glucose-1-phosphate uridylyltransferase
MKITKAIIPAAGLGTRFLPATKAIPKEMLPIVDKPTIQYLVEEAVASGITEIIIVTSKNKKALEDHFTFSPELSAQLTEKNKLKAVEELRKAERLAKFTYVEQPNPHGDGDAILCAKEYVKGEPFAVLFGDDIYDTNPPALAQLIEQYEKHNAPIIALQQIDKKDSDKYGIIDPKSSEGPLHEIKALIEKPDSATAPSDLAITGKYIITPELLETLANSTPGHDHELRLIDGMIEFSKTSSIYGYEVKGLRFDTGDKLGYLKAVVHFALKQDNLGPQFKKYLQGLDLK